MPEEQSPANKPDGAEKKGLEGYAKAGAYMGLVFVTPISGWVCYQIGLFLDRRYSSGWMALVGLLVGCTAGMYETFRQALRIEGMDRLPRSKDD